MKITQLTVELDNGEKVSLEKMGNVIFRLGDEKALSELSEFEEDKIDIIAGFAFNSTF